LESIDALHSTKTAVKTTRHARAYLFARKTIRTTWGGFMLALLWEGLIGLLVGAVAKFVMPGKDPGGILITMLLGIVGSFVATYLGQMIGWYRQGDAAGFVMSVAGAVLLLVIYRFLRGKSAKA
jgi:uncharacterized membrane protein YeaQ/YmgE (transglycosylase-associated protein family)